MKIQITIAQDLTNGMRILHGFALLVLVGVVMALHPSRAMAGGGLDPKGLSKETEVLDVEALFPSEEGLVNIQVGTIAEHDFLARYMNDSLFVPFTGVADLLRLNSSISPDLMTLSLEIKPKGEITISRQRSMVEYGTESFSFPVTSLRIVHGEIYIDYTLLSKILGIPMMFDVNSLKLLITADDRLPVVQWSRNQSRYQSLLFDQHDGRDQTTTQMERRFFSAPVINWNLGTMFEQMAGRGYTAQFRFGNQFLFGTFDGAVNLSMTPGAVGGLHAAFDALSWRYQTPDFSPLRQVTVGALLIDGNSRQGVELSNMPLIPEKNSRTFELTGRTQPTWTVELYDGTRLVDVTQADSVGRYMFKIPMSYGTLDRLVRILGPHGEILTEARRVNLTQQMVPAGAIQYEAGIGVDSISSASGIASGVHVAAGITDRLTVGVDGSYHTATLGGFTMDSLSPSAHATLWLGQSTTAGISYNVRRQNFGGDVYTTTADNASYHLTADSISIANRSAHAIGAALYPIGDYSVGANAEFGTTPDRTQYAVEPLVSGYAAGVTFLASTRFGTTTFVNAEQALTAHQLSSSLRLMGSPTPGLLLSAQGTYDFTSQKIAMLNFSSYVRLGSTIGLNLAYQVNNLDWKNGMLEATFNLDLNSFRSMVSSSYSAGHTTTMTAIHGSAIISTHGILAFADPSVGQSSVLIEAFDDKNSNGIRDNDEELISAPSARLSMDGSDMTTEDGLFHAVPADRQCMIELDRWAHASEGLYPGSAHISIFTLPNELHVIEIPFSEGFDVTGSCAIIDNEGSHERSNHGQTEGLRVKLISTSDDGEFDGEVYVDGSILVSAVTTGDYKLTFDAAQLASRRIQLAEEPQIIHLTPKSHRLPQVHLQLAGGR